MEIKKSKEADLERERSGFVLLGLLFAFSSIYIAFEWANVEKQEVTNDDIVKMDIGDEEMAPQTTQPDLPPPPPAAAPAMLDPVIEFNVNKNATSTNVQIASSEDEGHEVAAAPAPAIQQVVVAPVQKEDVQQVYTHVDKKAEFPGGETALYGYLSQNIHYPEAARENGIQGAVFLQFTVNIDGSIEDIEVKRSPDVSLEKEAIRVVKSMPRWAAGENNHKKVRSRFILPIQFKLGN